MESIVYIDRVTGKECVEKVYGGATLNFLYGNSWASRILGQPLMHTLSRWPFISAAYGYLQKQSCSKKKICLFIDKFQMDPSEFMEKINQFSSFNDFFIRKLKPESRPIVKGDNIAIIPADARYYFHQDIEDSQGFVVKGQKFDLHSLLKDQKLANKYAKGSLVIARLCPTDYHRFHFPCDCVPEDSHFINGWLYSVNPIAIKKNIHIFTQNKRCVTSLKTHDFGEVLYLEIGATNVGSIHETYTPNKFYLKGAEKGYFSFGASALIILFEEGKIKFDPDLVSATKKGVEIRCLLGQSMGDSRFIYDSCHLADCIK